MKAFFARRCHGEAGLTLNELLLAMVISAIIVVPIGGAIFTTLRTSSSTMNRTGQSIGANQLSTYFGPDVENAIQAQTATMEVSCGSNQQVGLLLTTGPDTSISYYQGATQLTQMNLYRRTCSAGTASAPILLMRYVSAAPDFHCDASPCGTAWTSVTAVVTQSDQSLNPTPFTTTVQASRRTI